MKCKDVELNMAGYMGGELHYKKLGEFISHIELCNVCREELEIKYIVEYGMSDEYANRHGSYDFIKLIQDDIDKSKLIVKKAFRIKRHRICEWCFNNFVMLLGFIYMLYQLGII